MMHHDIKRINFKNFHHPTFLVFCQLQCKARNFFMLRYNRLGVGGVA